LRYQFLFEQAELLHAQAVATAHHADDQVETILMHLLRGSGLFGLKGMDYCSTGVFPRQPVPLVRPLLGTWKEEILSYCTEFGICGVEDATNADTNYFRNRIRHNLIPILQDYNPEIKQRLWNTSQVVSGELDLLITLEEKAWMECGVESNQGWLSLDYSTMSQLPMPMQRRLLRRGFHLLLPDARDLDFEAVERGVAFIHTPSKSSAMDWIQNIQLFVQQGRLVFLNSGEEYQPPEWVQMEDDDTIPLKGVVGISNGWQINVEEVCAQNVAMDEIRAADDNEIWLDAKKITAPLMLRSRQTGDVIHPLGMEGHTIKVSDVMVNRGMPRLARRKWPLVSMGNDILWIVGQQRSEICKMDDGTVELIHIKLSQKKQDA
jgi:tRNA(Ile)-lysidine synthase